MDSIKSNFYACFPVKSCELNRQASTKSIFSRWGSNYYPKTNKYVEKLLELINASRNDAVDYDYLLGWECAKIILPKVCIDVKYVVRIMITMQSASFIKGFYDYANQQFAKFEFDRSFITFKSVEEKNIRALFPEEKVNVECYKSSNDSYSTRFSKKEYKSLLYDGIVSSEYQMISNLHPKGFFLGIIPRELAGIKVMFNGFLFNNVMLVDNPILSELLTICNSVHNSSRQANHITKINPDEPSNATHDVYEKVYNDMEIKNLLNYINSRQTQLNLFDYCAIWANHNESFLKTKKSTLDILDFSGIEESKFTDNNNNNDKNESNNQ
jgi:hypothetical protein